MAFFSKPQRPDEPAGASLPATAPAATAELPDLLTQIEQLRGQLDQANRQVIAYLLKREAQAVAGGAVRPSAEGASTSTVAAAPAFDPAVLAPLGDKLDELAARIDGVGRQSGGMCDTLRRLQEQVSLGFQQVAQALAPPPPEPEPTVDRFAPAAPQWEQAILGAELAASADLAFQREELLRGVISGDEGARALAGQLLIFQSTPADRKPQLLKELGEAYYRWHPKVRPGVTAFERALAEWLKHVCDRNTIDLVEPGDRFDTNRHNADSRGVEVIEVRGWVVLRDNGKVYSRAQVAVR